MSAAAAHHPKLILLMGVAGSGKTTLGRLLAQRLAYVFVDADDFHDAAAIARMRGGAPLADDERDAWVERLARALTQLHDQRTNCVLAFSGLRARHRRRLMGIGFATAAFMLEGSAPLLDERLSHRADHFMPAAQLPDQIATMEAVQPDERIEPLDVAAPPDVLVAALLGKLPR
jgi:gluconokinase